MKGAKTMEHKPRQIILDARGKAEEALLKCCGKEVKRICDAFSYDTGLLVTGVRFNTVDIRTIGESSPKMELNWPTLEHERV
jgi:hypothetical protein